MEYLAKWPELCNVVVDYPNSWGGEGKERIVGYGMLHSLFSFPSGCPMVRGARRRKVPRMIRDENDGGIGCMNNFRLAYI